MAHPKLKPTYSAVPRMSRVIGQGAFEKGLKATVARSETKAVTSSVTGTSVTGTSNLDHLNSSMKTMDIAGKSESPAGDSEAIEFRDSSSAIADDTGLGVVNSQYVSSYRPEKIGFEHIGTPDELAEKLSEVGYHCLHTLAVQTALCLNTPTTRTRALLLEGPSGCGKSFLAKSLAKISGAELMCLSCYEGMNVQHLVEVPSTLAMVNAMVGKDVDNDPTKLVNLGIISRAFLTSHKRPVVLLIDELDKPHRSIDTFFLGPIQDARVWLESRPPIDANPKNLLIIFTKNYNRTLDEALLRRVHPVKLTYLNSSMERKILSPYCHPRLVSNIVDIADRMRNSGGSYQFERPPAPEEILTIGQYVTHLIRWNLVEPAFVAKSIWAILAKSEHDRAVLEHMLRFHPDFLDPDHPDARSIPLDEIHARLGRVILDGVLSNVQAAA